MNFDEELFDHAISNSPYQESVNGKNSDIWKSFIELGSNVSHRGSFIHPGRWVIPKKSMITVQESLIELGLTNFIYLSQTPFPGLYIDGNVSITYFDYFYPQKEITYCVNLEESKTWSPGEMFFANEFEEELFNKFAKLLEKGSMMDICIGKLGSQSGWDFGYKKTEHFKHLSKTPAGLTKPVKIWANPGFGKGSRFEWLFIEESVLNIDDDYISASSSRKVMLDKKGHAPFYPDLKGNVFNNSAEIVESGVIASEKVFLLPLKGDLYHLELISSLMMTRVARALMAIVQKDLYVRGLELVPLYTVLAELLPDGELFTDDWFFEEFDFSGDLRQYVVDLVSLK